MARISVVLVAPRAIAASTVTARSEPLPSPVPVVFAGLPFSATAISAGWRGDDRAATQAISPRVARTATITATILRRIQPPLIVQSAACSDRSRTAPTQNAGNSIVPSRTRIP